jgi:hypothetical protein
LSGESERARPVDAVPAMRRFAELAGGYAVGVVGIVILLLPRRPISAWGWAAYLAVLALSLGVFHGLARLLRFLENRPGNRWANRALGVVVAVAPGLALVYEIFSHADFLTRHFR